MRRRRSGDIVESRELVNVVTRWLWELGGAGFKSELCQALPAPPRTLTLELRPAGRASRSPTIPHPELHPTSMPSLKLLLNQSTFISPSGIMVWT